MTWWGPVCKPRTWDAETGEFPVGIPSVKKKIEREGIGKESS